MKQISNLLSGILLSTALLTSCSKNDNNMASPSNAPGASAKAFTNTLDFRSGGISASSIQILAGQKMLYQTDMPTTVDLGALASSLRVQPTRYADLTMKINTAVSDAQMNFWLTDEMVMENGETIPVMFVMEEPISIRVARRDIGVIDATTIMELMNIQGDALAKDIPRDMLLNAEREDKVLKISKRVNPDLYQMILDRLNTMIDISYNNTDPGPTTSFPSTPIPTVAQTPDERGVNGAGTAPTALAQQKP